MAWYQNHYTCDRCGGDWTDEWSCTCDDDCPNCGARHMSPHDSDDLTHVVEKQGDEFLVLRSPRPPSIRRIISSWRHFRRERQQKRTLPCKRVRWTT